MRHDLLALGRLEALRRWRQLVYWLQVLGVKADDSLAYKIYFALFALLWVTISWAWATDQTYQTGRRLRAEDATLWLNAIQNFVVIIIAFATWRGLRQSPLKFTGPETMLLVAAPLTRSIVVGLQCVKSIALFIIPAAVVASIVSMLLNWSRYDSATVGQIGLMTLIATSLLVCCIVASMWIVGLLKYRYPQSARFLWLIPVSLVVAAFLIPDLILPVRWWSHVTQGIAYGTSIFGLSATAIGLVLIVARLGHNLNLARAVEDSQIYARIARLGFSLNNRALAADIRSEARIIDRAAKRITLPSGRNPQLALFARSLHTTFTPLWSGTLKVIVIGIGFASSSLFFVSNIESLNLLTAAPILLGLIYLRPTVLVAAFVQDYNNPFTRQFIPQNNLWLFILDGAYLWLFSVLGASAVYVLYFGMGLAWLLATAIFAGVIVLLALCIAISTVSRTALQIQIAYEYALIFCVVGLGGAFYLTSSVLMVGLALFGLIVLFGTVLHGST